MEKPIMNTTELPCTDYEYKKHMNRSIEWCQWLMTPMGIWLNSRTVSRSRKSFSWLINASCFSLIGFLFFPCILYVFLEVGDMYNKLRLFGPLIFVVMVIVKYCFFIHHKADIRECVKRIEWDWRNIGYPEDRDIMITNANFGRRLMILCTIFVYSGFTFYYIAVPISVGRIPTGDQNYTHIPLAFPFTRYILDAYHSPVNEIVFSIQLVGGTLIHGIVAAACSLAATLAVHACGQMKVLMNWIDHLIDGRSDMSKTVNGRIASIVRQHVRILKFLALTEKTLQQISFVEFLGCTVDICLAGYYIITDLKSNDFTKCITYVILLISLTFNIFIFCYIGELVAEHCRKIGEMCYTIEWHRLPGNTKLCCILIIAMANSSIKLTAGNMVTLCIGTFSNVVNTAVAFLNVLRSTT